MAIRISPDIAGIVPYSPGKPIEEVERELGITGSIKLASNENPRGPSPKALAVLAEAAKTVNRYPDGGGYYLRDALAERWKVTPNQIILGNGSDEVITLLTKAFLEPGDEAVMADPSFVVYKIDVAAEHAKPVLVPLKEHRHDLPAMAKAVTPKTRLAFICNPNNPTGTYVAAAAVTAFMRAIPPEVIVVFDADRAAREQQGGKGHQGGTAPAALLVHVEHGPAPVLLAAQVELGVARGVLGLDGEGRFFIDLDHAGAVQVHLFGKARLGFRP